MRFWTRASAIDSRRPVLATSSVGGALAVAVAVPPRTRPWYADVWIQMLRKKPLGTIGGVIVVVMLTAALLADIVVPYGFAQTSLSERFIAMNGAHWLGTDQLGRDLLTRLIYGARISLYVGFGAVLIGCVLATAIGVLSAYFGGRFDLWLQRGVDAWMAFPPLLLLMSIMSLLGPNVWNITAVLGVAFGIQNSRIVRGVALRDLHDPRLKGGDASVFDPTDLTTGAARQSTDVDQELIAYLDQRFSQLKSELRSEIARELRANIAASAAGVKSELRADIA